MKPRFPDAQYQYDRDESARSVAHAPIPSAEVGRSKRRTWQNSNVEVSYDVPPATSAASPSLRPPQALVEKDEEEEQHLQILSLSPERIRNAESPRARETKPSPTVATPEAETPVLSPSPPPRISNERRRIREDLEEEESTYLDDSFEIDEDDSAASTEVIEALGEVRVSNLALLALQLINYRQLDHTGKSTVVLNLL